MNSDFNQNGTKNNKTWLIVVLVLVIIGAVAAAVVILGGKKDESSDSSSKKEEKGNKDTSEDVSKYGLLIYKDGNGKLCSLESYGNSLVKDTYNGKDVVRLEVDNARCEDATPAFAIPLYKEFEYESDYYYFYLTDINGDNLFAYNIQGTSYLYDKQNDKTVKLVHGGAKFLELNSNVYVKITDSNDIGAPTPAYIGIYDLNGDLKIGSNQLKISFADDKLYYLDGVKLKIADAKLNVTEKTISSVNKPLYLVGDYIIGYNNTTLQIGKIDDETYKYEIEMPSTFAGFDLNNSSPDREGVGPYVENDKLIVEIGYNMTKGFTMDDGENCEGEVWYQAKYTIDVENKTHSENKVEKYDTSFCGGYVELQLEQSEN